MLSGSAGTRKVHPSRRRISIGAVGATRERLDQRLAEQVLVDVEGLHSWLSLSRLSAKLGEPALLRNIPPPTGKLLARLRRVQTAAVCDLPGK